MGDPSGSGCKTIGEPKAEIRDGQERVHDIEQALDECRRESEAARQELDLLCYAISHDLRAPLRAIEGFSEALEEDCADRVGEEGRQYLGRLRAASRRMVQMIDGILDLSRLARTPLDRQEVDLGAIARSVAGELSRRDPDRNVHLTIGEGVPAKGDPRLLRLLMEALLDNAWKFTGQRAEGSIEFGATESEEGPVYFVRDNGVGFDIGFAGKLFTPFQRLHAASDFGGLGMGLARVRRVVHRHGGRVWAEATVDGGATFSFTLCGSTAV